MNNTLIGTKELCSQTGATLRQLHYWRMQGVIEVVGRDAPGTGHLVYFDEAIVSRVALLVKISRKFPNVHTDLHKIVYDHFDDGFVDLGDGIVLEWLKG